MRWLDVVIDSTWEHIIFRRDEQFEQYEDFTRGLSNLHIKFHTIEVE